jgi:arylformamidase
MSNIIDLTHVINESMPVFPGTPQPRLITEYTVAINGFMETRLDLLSHTGTHMDAPAHMLAQGLTLDRMPVSTFCGNAVCIDVSGVYDQIELGDLLQTGIDFTHVDFIVLHTDWSRFWGHPLYFVDFPVLTQEAAHYLVGCGLKGIAADSISFDKHDSVSYSVHHILLNANLVLIENLRNTALLPKDKVFWFAALPLNYIQADGSPVRAIASWE